MQCRSWARYRLENLCPRSSGSRRANTKQAPLETGTYKDWDDWSQHTGHTVWWCTASFVSWELTGRWRHLKRLNYIWVQSDFEIALTAKLSLELDWKFEFPMIFTSTWCHVPLASCCLAHKGCLYGSTSCCSRGTPNGSSPQQSLVYYSELKTPSWCGEVQNVSISDLKQNTFS